eukprot:793462_1
MIGKAKTVFKNHANENGTASTYNFASIVENASGILLSIRDTIAGEFAVDPNRMGTFGVESFIVWLNERSQTPFDENKLTRGLTIIKDSDRWLTMGTLVHFLLSYDDTFCFDHVSIVKNVLMNMGV